MYLANRTRPDIAWTVGMHCRNMSSPTPELLVELDYCFTYLARNSAIGLTFDAKPTEPSAYCDASLEVNKSTSGYTPSSGKERPSPGALLSRSLQPSPHVRLRSKVCFV